MNDGALKKFVPQALCGLVLLAQVNSVFSHYSQIHNAPEWKVSPGVIDSPRKTEITHRMREEFKIITVMILMHQRLNDFIQLNSPAVLCLTV